MNDDERPTPDLGYPAQPDPRRTRTPVLGVPAYDPPRRARSRADTDELEIDPDIERAFDVLVKRRLRPYRWLLGLAFTIATGAGGGAIKGAIDGARASERDRVRIDHLERTIDFLQGRLFGPFVSQPAPSAKGISQ